VETADSQQSLSSQLAQQLLNSRYHPKGPRPQCQRHGEVCLSFGRQLRGGEKARSKKRLQGGDCLAPGGAVKKLHAHAPRCPAALHLDRPALRQVAPLRNCVLRIA
jgi:hypothetical protein